MKLIVGLGNPGEKYQNSRHNVGFFVVEEVAANGIWHITSRCARRLSLLTLGLADWQKTKEFNSLIGKSKDVILVKPQTFMNGSGDAVSKIANFYKIAPADIWIIHDDLDLTLGKLKIRLGGAAAGHHGVESIIEKLGTDKFYRFRLGIGRPDESEYLKDTAKRREVTDFVISDFRPEDRDEVQTMVKRTSEAVLTALDKGMERAMNEFNI